MPDKIVCHSFYRVFTQASAAREFFPELRRCKISKLQRNTGTESKTFP